MANVENNNTEVPPKVIATIQKLLARASTKRGSTEDEADSFLKGAQELMAKWNLDMAAIEAAGTSHDDTGHVRVKEEMQGRAMYKWQQQLAKYVAEANFCYHMLKAEEEYVDGYYRRDGKKIKPEDHTWDDEYVRGHWKTTKRNVFVGRKANVITAQLMFQYLTRTIEDNLPFTDNSQRLSRSAMSWKEGCADRLCERLAARRKDLIKQHDARVKAEEADQKAERERSAKEAAEREQRRLAANPEAEVKAKVDNLKATARDASGLKPEPEEPERPEVDQGDDWTPGDNAESSEQKPTGTALVLASVYDETEREANYEMAHGYEPGTLARWRAEQEQERRERAEEEAKKTTEKLDEPERVETERQRKARERREAEDARKARARWAREDRAEANRQAREWAKKDHAMYRKGAEKGKEIGLDPQVKAKADVKRLGN